jgi:hypothetical protein
MLEMLVTSCISGLGPFWHNIPCIGFSFKNHPVPARKGSDLYWEVGKDKQEGLGRINRLLSFNTTRTAWKMKIVRGHTDIKVIS